MILMIKQYDNVKLKDGRKACIVEVFEQGVAYLVDIGDSPEAWETIDIKHEDIQAIFEEIERPITKAG